MSFHASKQKVRLHSHEPLPPPVSVCVRYLVLEKLKKDDAQRIHVFSSFFYKRLNQRERRNAPDTGSLP